MCQCANLKICQLNDNQTTNGFFNKINKHKIPHPQIINILAYWHIYELAY
jgi:hypothetical protein